MALPDRSRKTGPINQKAQDAVQKSLDSVTGDKSTGIAGLVFVAVNKKGEEIAAAASGNRGLNTKTPMDLETVFWIASCTKLLATMACMQAVEKGTLSLDDHKQVYKYAPELEKVKVLQDDGSLVDKKKEITLRMLLSHTAGVSLSA
jgi:CubicO group peptidase (beta-lactamase class C family)